MSISENNEITVRAKCTYEQLDRELRNNGFEKINEYNFSDIFLIPNTINIYKETNRRVLEKAILLREATGITTNKNSKKITFKKKIINDNGEIIKQSAIKCNIDNIEDAKQIFLAIGYKELMKIKEIHIIYQKSDIKFIVKRILNGSVLIEFETNPKYAKVEQLIDIMKNLNLSVDLSNFFVKKAEEELQKIKDKGEK